MNPELSRRSAANMPETHARHNLLTGPPYSLDSVLHLARYQWVMDHLATWDDVAVDLGCGTGFGVEILASQCRHVTGVDFDPLVTMLSERYPSEKVSFRCDDICEGGLANRLGLQDVDLVTSMETIEHLENYFAAIENAVELMSPQGVFIVGTPNRVLTYNRYPDRRHMDPSHVQEFTPISLARILSGYFETVDIFFEHIPGYWGEVPK